MNEPSSGPNGQGNAGNPQPLGIGMAIVTQRIVLENRHRGRDRQLPAQSHGAITKGDRQRRRKIATAGFTADENGGKIGANRLSIGENPGDDRTTISIGAGNGCSGARA